MGSSYGYVLAIPLVVSDPLSLEESWQMCRRLDIMIHWLPEAVRAVVFELPFRQTPFFDPSLSSPLPFQQDSVPAP